MHTARRSPDGLRVPTRWPLQEVQDRPDGCDHCVLCRTYMLDYVFLHVGRYKIRQASVSRSDSLHQEGSPTDCQLPQEQSRLNEVSTLVPVVCLANSEYE
ncbi:hypothetical protein J6590_094408 [Homalodisca vitripennis]|nr:hypothetical protein J6590_094408 [Homalodisca vitripennis]